MISPLFGGISWGERLELPPFQTLTIVRRGHVFGVRFTDATRRCASVVEH